MNCVTRTLISGTKLPLVGIIPAALTAVVGVVTMIVAGILWIIAKLCCNPHADSMKRSFKEGFDLFIYSPIRIVLAIIGKEYNPQPSRAVTQSEPPKSTSSQINIEKFYSDALPETYPNRNPPDDINTAAISGKIIGKAIKGNDNFLHAFAQCLNAARSDITYNIDTIIEPIKRHYGAKPGDEFDISWLLPARVGTAFQVDITLFHYKGSKFRTEAITCPRGSTRQITVATTLEIAYIDGHYLPIFSPQSR